MLQGGNSTKDLIIIPDSEYKVTSITINGTAITFMEDENGIVTLPKFENMTEDKHIIVTFEQIKGKITVNKVDNSDNTKLSGATFKLEKLDDAGNVDTTFTVQEKTTGDTGIVEFTDLLIGKYQITETKAPEGYELNTEVTKVDVTRENRNLNLTLKNREKLD